MDFELCGLCEMAKVSVWAAGKAISGGINLDGICKIMDGSHPAIMIH